jgi:hypothetical protein
MAQLPYEHKITGITAVGQTLNVTGSGIDAAKAEALADAKAKVAIFTPYYSVKTFRDASSPATSGSTGESSDAILILRDTEYRQKTIKLQDVAAKYFLASSAGKIDITDADILAIVTAYNAATGVTYTLRDGIAVD